MGWRKYAKPVLNPRDTFLESKSTLHRKYLLNKAYVVQASEELSCGRNCCPRFCTYMEKHELRFSKLNIWNIFLINLAIAKLVTQAWCYKEQSPAPKFSKIHISLLHIPSASVSLVLPSLTVRWMRQKSRFCTHHQRLQARLWAREGKRPTGRFYKVG